eukprot:c4150_g1_i1.p1 GENE.c4150_g1_i1~~c4150_g1_i1.p1  ORF type:complete len:261 (+),score=69.54 c4150_g1_i1:450-1232(+)
MELLKGPELLERIIDRGAFSEMEARKVAQMLLEALNYMHEHGVVHRDLKLENIMYASKEDNASLKIVDFGASKFFERGDSFATMVGTPLYLAPEVRRNRGYTSQVDMWSCGVILYTLLSGLLPFDVNNPDRMVRQIQGGIIDFPSEHWKNVSLEAVDFVRKCLTVDPSRRLTPQEGLNHAWMKVDGSSLNHQVVDAERLKWAAQRFLKVARVFGAVSTLRRLGDYEQLNDSIDKGEANTTEAVLSTHNSTNSQDDRAQDA